MMKAIQPVSQPMDYILHLHDANAQRLIALDLATRQETVVAEDPQYDGDGVLIHPVSHYPSGFVYKINKSRYSILVLPQI